MEPKNFYRIGPLYADNLAIAHGLLQKAITAVLPQNRHTKFSLNVSKFSSDAIRLARDTFKGKLQLETNHMYTNYKEINGCRGDE